MYNLDRTFTTLYTAPTVTTNEVDNITATEARLKGTVNVNDSSTSVKFKYGLAGGGPYTDSVVTTESPVNGLISTAVTQTISGMNMDITYYYICVGNNVTGGNISGGQQSFITCAAPLLVIIDPPDNVTA